MRWNNIENGSIHLTQNKTSQVLAIPLIARLCAVLAETPRAGLTIVTGRHGKPLYYHAAARAVRKAREAVGALDYTIHGWRYTAASQLAEAGCSDDEVQSITGHSANAMVVKYTQAARQKARAKSAQGKRNQNRT